MARIGSPAPDQNGLLPSVSRRNRSKVSGSMSIDRNELRVWSMKTSEVPHSIPSAYVKVLQRWEHARASAFVHESDRRDYICAHALRRALLADCFGLRAGSWDIEQRHLQKPIIATPIQHGTAESNLTHTRGFVAVVVGLDCAVGIDAEDRNRHIEPDAASLICSTSEHDFLNAIPSSSPARRELLLHMWVRKEALLKAMGVGLSFPLPAIDLDHNGHPSLSHSTFAIGAISDWRIWNIDAGPSHLVAVGAHHCGRSLLPTHQAINWHDLEDMLLHGNSLGQANEDYR